MIELAPTNGNFVEIEPGAFGIFAARNIVYETRPFIDVSAISPGDELSVIESADDYIKYGILPTQGSAQLASKFPAPEPYASQIASGEPQRLELGKQGVHIGRLPTTTYSHDAIASITPDVSSCGNWFPPSSAPKVGSVSLSRSALSWEYALTETLPGGHTARYGEYYGWKQIDSEHFMLQNVAANFALRATLYTSIETTCYREPGGYCRWYGAHGAEFRCVYVNTACEIGFIWE